MNADPTKPAPLFGVVTLIFLISLFAIPPIGYLLTSNAIDNTPSDGQNFGVVILGIMGVVGVVVALGLVGLGSAITGGIALSRGERRRWAGLLGLIGGGLVFLAVAGAALFLYMAA